MLPDLSDKVIIQRMRSGEREIFDIMFRAYYAELVRFAESYLAVQDEAHEIVSDLFVRLMSDPEECHISGSVRAYLFRSVRNRVLNSLRDSSKRAALMQNTIEEDVHPHSSGDPTNILEASEDQAQIAAIIDQALGSLTPRVREAASLYWRQGLTVEEIAAVTGTAPGTIHTQLSRALKALKDALPRYLP